ncbi:hypothetical protein GTP46_27660 [Duganella sp. FT135W]|uniref:Uncharacterized protein n=1 Tax=Duganella flavida TaxID=2692175 RepID=A0A6L8KG73_9BURK|nr:hypothetical protein [Duganella flavida]MYM26409.1 hypothetical protein [Duganella flavida]
MNNGKNENSNDVLLSSNGDGDLETACKLANVACELVQLSGEILSHVVHLASGMADLLTKTSERIHFFSKLLNNGRKKTISICDNTTFDDIEILVCDTKKQSEQIMSYLREIIGFNSDFLTAALPKNYRHEINLRSILLHFGNLRKQASLLKCNTALGQADLDNIKQSLMEMEDLVKENSYMANECVGAAGVLESHADKIFNYARRIGS